MTPPQEGFSIKSLERGLSILEIIGKSPHPLTITEISQQNNLNKATALRFVRALCSLGYATQENGKRYSLGAKTLSFGFSFLNRSNLIMAVKPYLDELSSKLQKSVNLAVLDEDHIVFLYRKEIKRFLKYDMYPGLRIPAHCLSSGKVLLAALNDEKVQTIINGMDLVPVTAKTITSKELLFKEIVATRKRGYGISDQELSMDLYSLAVPLFNHQGTPAAAFNISMDARDKNKAMIRRVVLPMMFECGKTVSEILGFKGHYPEFHS